MQSDAAPPPHPMEESTDEPTAWQPLQSEFRRLAKLLDAVAVRPSDRDLLTQVEGALSKLPPGETFGRAIDELRDRAETFLSRARRARTERFGRVVTEFLKGAVERGRGTREVANGWRVGVLEFELKRDQALARASYNREPLGDWKAVTSRDDLDRLEETALAMLERAALPEDVLVTTFWRAYERGRAQRRRDGASDTRLVSILDFYRDVRVALVEQELAEGKPDKKLQRTELPRWAFLYNLDCYRALGATVPDEMRIGLQTGSQQEVSRGMGVVVNGMDPRDDYKVMCHVVSHSATTAP